MAALAATTLTAATDASPRAFENVYVGASLDSVYPISNSQDFYSKGGVSPALQYRYFMKDEWLIGVSGGFKLLQDLSGTDAPLFTIEQKTTKLFRIYYPFWLGFGISGVYIVGVEKVSFPYQRNRDVPVQIGAGVHSMLLYKMDSGLVSHIAINRWGGTIAKNKINILETSLGITYALGTSK